MKVRLEEETDVAEKHRASGRRGYGRGQEGSSQRPTKDGQTGTTAGGAPKATLKS